MNSETLANIFAYAFVVALGCAIIAGIFTIACALAACGILILRAVGAGI